MYASSLPSLFTLAEPQADGYLSSPSIPLFPEADPYGHIYEAQIEFTYADEMLQVLMQLTPEAEQVEALPADGLYALFAAVQARIAAGRLRLRTWQEQQVVAP